MGAATRLGLKFDYDRAEADLLADGGICRTGSNVMTFKGAARVAAMRLAPTGGARSKREDEELALA